MMRTVVHLSKGSDMRRTSTLRALLVIASLAPIAMPATGSAAPRSSSNIQLVAEIRDRGGTDLELFSRSVLSYRDRDGATIVVAEPVRRHFALLGDSNSPVKIADITDPEDPYLASSLTDCVVSQADPQVTADGMLAAIGFQSGTCTTAGGRNLTAGSALVDLTDVYAPVIVGGTTASGGSHNNTIHPSGKYLYMSNSNTTTTSSTVPIFDISDPAAPKLVRNWITRGNSPHDIRFNADGSRAYMAGISQYRIVDTSDPESPVLISTIVPPGGTIGHDALVTADGAFLFLGDEGGGGATYPCPGGPVFVYDIRDETLPVLLGAAEAGIGPVTGRQVDEAFVGPAGGCTAHVMDMNPDGRSFTLGWYVGGTRSFSFAGLYGPDGAPAPGPALAYGPISQRVVETGYIVPEGGSTWAAKQYRELRGYIFSNDIVRGFYVSKIV